MGLFTTNGIKKPPYYAMAMMAKLGDSLLKSGEGYFITRRGEHDLVMVLYNYEHCNPLLVDEGLGLTPTSRDGVFPSRSSLDVSLTLSNLPASAYRIRETILNQTHGSCFDQWVNMGAEELGPTEMEWLRRNSSPALRLTTVNIKGTLQYTANLAPQEVRLVEISPAEHGCFG
jgi:xylan 1,4-beta-xylosidase